MVYETIAQFRKMLHNFEGCMTKAAAFADHKKFDPNVFVQTRLYPDMYSLVRQIQASCDAAKFCAAYMAGQTAPKHEDTETTWAECRARLQKAIAYLDTMKPADFKNWESVKVSPKWANGKWIAGKEYLQDIAIPNFYFHITTAYAILRHSGVEIGKMDYLGKVNMRD